MLKTKSRDGVYNISAPDNAKTGCRLMTIGEKEEEKFDKVQDVYLEVIEGKDANVLNLAEAICCDCFDFDGLGLHLLAKELKCHVKAGEKKYEFTVGDYNSVGSYLEVIANQIKL